MRIVLISSIRFYGGGEKRVLRLATEFTKRGHTVTVIGHADAELARHCGDAGIPFEPFEFGSYRSPRPILALAALLRKLSPAAAVSFDERSVRLASVAARLAGGVRLAHYIGLEGSFKNKPYNRWVVAPGTRRIVTNAEATRRELLGYGWLSPERVAVIYNGVDPSAIDAAQPAGAREELGDSSDDVIGLVAARLVPEKGHAFLLDVLAEISPSHPALKVWLAGEGPEEAALRRQIASRGLESRVRLLGFRTDVPRLMRAADLLIHPSRREGAPNAVREAMAAGLPVVAVAASGTPEVMLDGETGLLSRVGDSAGLKANLERVLGDADLRRRMGEAGYRHARTEFSEDRCAERWLELLAECAA